MPPREANCRIEFHGIIFPFLFELSLKFWKRNMNYTFLPSLEHIVLVKIATNLWNQSDIRALIVKFYFDGSIEDMISLMEIGEKVKEKVLLLNTPSSLKEKILGVILPIGFEIYKFIECNKKFYNIAVNLPDEFSWTPHGTIDRKKTAEALMTDEAIDIAERYKLACIYCLKNYVGALWEKLPENHRASFYSEDDPRKVAQHDLVVFWTYDIKGEMAKLENIIRWRTCEFTEMTETCTPEQYPLKCAFIHSNKVAAEYFWSKLSLEDREDSLRFMVNNWGTEHYHDISGISDWLDILHFLFPRVSKDQQIALFEKYRYKVFLCFLDWPWQSLFMDMINHLVLTSLEFYATLDMIVKKVCENRKDYDYQRLFGEFWHKGTENDKKYVMYRLCDRDSLLLDLFRKKDVKNISLILKDASVLEKAALRDSIGSRIFANLYFKEKFDMLEFFIDEFISSHEVLIKFKGKCMKEFDCYDERLEKFLDNLIQNFNLKRNIEESHCSSA